MSERFEMRITKDWLDRLDRWCRSNSSKRGGIPSRSDAIRTLVDRAIEADEQWWSG
jgi:metal-responsive CopG/Arc/MetJ family transcriptional regulator